MQVATSLPFIVMFLIFYLIVIRPQSNERKKHEKQLANLKIGDKILTRGGIHGKIISFQGKDNSIVIIDAGSGNKINIERSYTAYLMNDSKAGK